MYYDPFYWYDKMLDDQYEAEQNGFDDVEEYEAWLEDKRHDEYDSLFEK